MPRTRRRRDARNAVALLIEDHRRLQKLFKDFDRLDRAEEEARIEIVETACAELKLHTILEEEIFYPAVRSKAAPEDADSLAEAAIEHEVAEMLIDRLGETEPGDPDYAALFKVLSGYVRQHIKEEERTLFPRARKMNGLDLEELCMAMLARRDQLLAAAESANEALEGELTEADPANAPKENAGVHRARSVR